MKDEEKKILSPSQAAAKATTSQFDLESDLPPDADIEDRFNDFWKKNGAFVFITIALLAVIVVGTQLSGYLKGRGEENLRAEFAQITTDEARLAFAEANSKHPLSGLAYLELADQNYRTENFLLASTYYEKASAILAENNPLLAHRAQLGSGIAYLRASNNLGLERLEDLANNPDAIETMRAEAAYHHAVATWEANRIAEAHRSLDLIDTFENAFEWQLLGRELRALIPALDTPAFANPS